MQSGMLDLIIVGIKETQKNKLINLKRGEKILIILDGLKLWH